MLALCFSICFRVICPTGSQGWTIGEPGLDAHISVAEQLNERDHGGNVDDHRAGYHGDEQALQASLKLGELPG